MPTIDGRETKSTHSSKNNQNGSNGTGNGEKKKKKKKRPRIRNRPRNKNNRLQNPDTPAPSTPIASSEIANPIQPQNSTEAVTLIETILPIKPKSPTTEHIDERYQCPTTPITTINSSELESANNTSSTSKETANSVNMKDLTNSKLAAQPASVAHAAGAAANASSGKTREQIMVEREAKKMAKQAKKTKTAPNDVVDSAANSTITAATPAANVQTDSNLVGVTLEAVVEKSEATVPCSTPSTFTSINKPSASLSAQDKTREQIKAEREAKKLAKQAAKATKSGIGEVAAIAHQLNELKLSENATESAATASAVVAIAAQPNVVTTEEKKKPVLTKAERRAIQEAQRAAKAQAQAQKKISAVGAKVAVSKTAATIKPAKIAAAPTATVAKAKTASHTAVKIKNCKVKLFNHLDFGRHDVNLFVNNPSIHAAIARLGEQYAKRTIVGSNARCIGFLNALKMAIQDFETPPKKEFGRSLETGIRHCVEYLQQCRPLAVSVSNAYKYIKHMLTQLPTDQPETELKQHLCHFIDTYIENQIGKAAQAISSSMQEKISNGDVILTFGCYICEEAHRRHVDFRVVVVDSRPFCEGQELLRRLTAKEIPCTYVLINAVGFVMPEVTKVLLGAHALLSNGYVMARAGTAQVALVARSFNVPVLVCCETHKFSERFQTDAIVYNELGNPNDLVVSNKCCLTNWQAKGKMSPLNLIYDITPPELVTAVVTEVSILPCTSVPVILRIKPTEIGYYS